ncbi:AAA family ATPase [Tsukamurella conjunctivitidis]|nr:AAA family ATPase [Tsukamurella conjunctivitidis]
MKHTSNSDLDGIALPSYRCGDNSVGLYEVLRALGHADEAVVSICTQESDDKKSFRGRTIRVEHLGQGWSPPDDVNVWFSPNPLTMEPGGSRKGGEADVSRGVALYVDLDVVTPDVKDKGLASLAECEQVIETLTASLGCAPAVVIESGHGLQPIWRVRDAPLITDGAVAWKTISARWAALVRQTAVTVNPDAHVDSIFNIDRVLRCPGSTNWKLPDEPVPARCSVNADAGWLDVTELAAILPEAPVASPVHAKGTHAKGRAVLDGFRSGAMSATVVGKVREVEAAIEDGADRHSTMNSATLGLVRLGAKGEPGVRTALITVEALFEAVGDSVGHDPDEFQRSLTGALRLIAGDPDYVALDFYTGGAFEAGGIWGPGSGWITNEDGTRSRRALPPNSASSIPDAGRRFTESLADVSPKKVDWLWWPWIPRGKLTMFEGEPDVGKSTMTLTWAALVTRGGPWPTTMVGEIETRNEKGLNEPASVVLVGVEDDLADTVVPRLLAAGADMQRVATLARPRDDKGRPVPFLIPDDVDRLKSAIEEVDAALVIVDPITAFMSDAVRPGSDTANRKALMEIADVAEQTGTAVVLVRHLNKATGMSAKHRGGGSIAFTALARSSLLAAKLPPSDERQNTDATHGLASIKGNLSRTPSALGYRLTSSRLDPDSPVVAWAGVLDEDADQLVGADGAKPDARKAAPSRDEAARMLKELLAGGPMDAKEVRRMVSAETGCSEKTVANAASKLLIVKTPIRGEGGKVDRWTWGLPSNTFRVRG